MEYIWTTLINDMGYPTPEKKNRMRGSSMYILVTQASGVPSLKVPQDTSDD